MGESLEFETWHFCFTMTFVLKGHRSSQIDVKGMKGKLYSDGQKRPLESKYEGFLLLVKIAKILSHILNMQFHFGRY